MNKFKKLATTAVSLVMAGTMVFGFAACGNDDNDEKLPESYSLEKVGDYNAAKVSALHSYMQTKGITTRNNANASGWTTAKRYWTYLSGASDTETKDLYGVRKENGDLDYTKYNSNATLNVAIGHDKLEVSTAYHKLGAKITMPDGNQYSDDDLKPAWRQMGEDLKITFNDVYKGWKTSNNLTNIIKGESSASYAGTDLFTTDLSVAVSAVSANTAKILNLAEYLDYMPHFKDFLEANPIVYLSLLQAGMDTTTGDGKAIYVAPYFDGNDDIERYCIMRQDWVKKLLDGNTALPANGADAYNASCRNLAVASFMGKTGKLTIESTNADGSGKVNIVKNYDAALTAAKDVTKPLGKAYNDIVGAAYAGDSGNIVDIMNAAISVKAGVTGDQLANLFRAYIDVCYQKEDGTAYYTAATRSNLFNGYDACWDADDLTALLRVAKTNQVNLTGSKDIPVEGIVPRSGQNDRTPDMVRLACQLYGVRGADSRYEYTYIDKDGNLKDARDSDEFFAACARLNLMKQEGLVADYSGGKDFGYTAGINTKGKGQAMMMYDYSQTQTLNGFAIEDPKVTGKEAPAGYYFAPVVTPVSKWDVDANGSIAANEYFRFTESWRSTKVSGLAANDAVKNDPAKLKATLQFIDYLYSQDGQIVSTYGPMASDADGTGGFWYNDAALSEEVEAGEYFRYKGVNYAGTYYKGRYTPTITENLYKSFKGLTVHGWKLGDNTTASGGILSFTTYARTLIGSTLPVGVKDQSFENQLTAKMGQVGAGKVGTGLALGTIKGMTLDIKPDSYWYTVVPTSLPVATDTVKNVLDNANQAHLKAITGTGSGKDFFSIMNWIILNGFTKNYNQQDEAVDLV